MYTSTQTDSLLATKQALIADGTLAQTKVASLVSDLAAKQPLITSSSNVVADTVKSRIFLPNNDAFYFFNTAQTSSLLELSNSSLGAVFSMGIRAPALSIAGDVGIGTATPTAKLDVIGNASVSGTLSVTGSILNQFLQVTNSSANSYSSLYLTASGVQMQLFAGAGSAVISTTSAHGLTIQANRFNSSPAALTISSASAVTCNTSFTNNSDASLKTPPVDASTEDALAMLKAVSARTYERVDLPGADSRLGFIAQEVEAALPSSWGNIVGATEAVAEHVDQEGNEVLSKPSTLTVDYARLNAVLWTCCKNMLARIEALEAAR